MKKKALSVLLALALVLGLFPALTLHIHAEDHTCVDSDDDQRCDTCSYCMGEHDFDPPYYNRGDESGHFPECHNCPFGYPEEKSAHIYDGESDYICNVCSYTRCPGHNYVWDEETLDLWDHWVECVVCGHETWESHYDNGEDDRCDACDACMNHDEKKLVWDERTWDLWNHWMACEDCDAGSWENHSDGEDEDSRCDVCGFNMACPHDDTESLHDESKHWMVCTVCEQVVYSMEPHSFEQQLYHVESDRHYPECDGCEYYSADEGEAHVDEDADEHCDACNDWIHEHTYEYEFFETVNGTHYPMCDLCGYYDSERGEACTDKSGDHGCDVCYTTMAWLCDDADGNHKCDVCRYQLPELCTDTDTDHVCDVDACKRYMRELCAADTEDSWICGTCGKNFCNHYFHHEPTSNGDGTHTGTCDTCGEVTEDCYAWHYDASRITETTHTAFCRCGYQLPDEEHIYSDWSSRSVASHVVTCEDCFYEKMEAHTTQNGICEVCEMQVTAYDDVYVCGVGLKNGQYLSSSGSITTTRPAGGYAYYKDGVLELNNYVYDGPGYLWKEYRDSEPDWAAIYATKDLILVLKGENSLKITWPDAAADEKNPTDGIAAEQNLTNRGDGSLTIQVNDDGVDAASGDVTIESGTLTITAGDHGLDVDGSVTVTGGTVNVTAGDDGFNVRDAIAISGGAVTIDAKDIGLDCSDGGVTITGGTLDITTRDYDGIEADGDVLISGGTVSIDAGGWGVYSFSNSVTISGGSVEIAANEDGIWVDGVVTISGGVITVQAKGSAIHGRSGVAISNGDLAASSQNSAAVNGDYGSVTITGGNLNLTAGTGMVVFGGAGITVEEPAALPEGVTVQEDEFGEFHISVDPDRTLSILAPFSAVQEGDSIQLAGVLWGVKVIFAAYDADGRMAELQVVEPSGSSVPVPDMDGTVKAFILNSRDIPACASLPIV